MSENTEENAETATAENPTVTPVTPEVSEPPTEVKAEKPKRTPKPPKPKKPLYKNTLKVSGKDGSKVITGTGTMADLKEKLGWDMPPTFGLVKGLVLMGKAVHDSEVTAGNPGRGRTAKVYNFNTKD